MSTAGFPLGPFHPVADNTVLEPQGDSWEASNVYNPAALVVDGAVVLLYRAHGPDKVSRIGIARSVDGVHFDRAPEPILVPEHDYERFGCEDPRATQIDGTTYLTYTGYDGTIARLCLATSSDLQHWDKHGPLFPDFNTWAALPYGPNTNEWSKAGAIVPERIDGRYWMYFGEGAIHAATSTDLLHWQPLRADTEPLHAPTPGAWDSTLVEIGAAPILTDDGLIVLLINGATATDPAHVDYRCGQIAIATAEPDRVLAVTREPWLRPTSERDRVGMVPNVTFVEGAVEHQGRWFAYYGQSDTTIGVAVHDPATNTWAGVHNR